MSMLRVLSELIDDIDQSWLRRYRVLGTHGSRRPGCSLIKKALADLERLTTQRKFCSLAVFRIQAARSAIAVSL
jgi:hypothetical protein